MKIFRILNLYACLGGNRYKWDESAKQAGIELEVTAVELDPELARLYKERFPNDTVIIEDAHQYLLDHYKEFDFIWSSPPCPSHSRMRKTNTGEGERKSKATYPDMKLYQEIIFLDNFFKGQYVVENVIPYYEPLIEAKKRGRHLYWTNFNLPSDINDRRAESFIHSTANQLLEFHDLEPNWFNSYKGEQRKDKIARNLVDYEAGKTILDVALGIYNKPKKVIGSLFDETYLTL